MSSQPAAVHVRRDPRGSRLLSGAAVFLLAYLAVSPVSGALADRGLPLPGAAAEVVAAYYAANPAAAFAGAGLQALSVAGLALFVTAIRPLLRTDSPAVARSLHLLGWVAVAAMVVSSAITCLLAVIAGSVSPQTVETLRMAGFYSGGVVHVVALGGFVLGTAIALGRIGVAGRPSRWFGYVIGALAVLSLLSVAIYYASVLLPVGRVASMLWIVVVAILTIRRRGAVTGRSN